MRSYPLANDLITLEVAETGAMLGGVTFDLGGRRIAPMHTAPWADEELPDDVPPMLRTLRGDFLAAPFGENDLLEDEKWAHGATANGRWLEIGRDDGRLELELDGAVLGARVRATVEVRPGQPVVYQRHVFEGGRGRLPLGHHAMLGARSALRLSFAPWRWAGTPPSAIEVPPQGRSALHYPQRIKDLEHAEVVDGGSTDLTRFPVLENAEDLWMLASDEGVRLGWTAATCEAEGWVWFSLKDPRVLPSTVVWMSNGGRDYPPFSGRHRRVVGLEEVCANFHLGHRASLEGGAPGRAGIPTALELTRERPLVVAYLFGVAALPPGFGSVRELQADNGEIRMQDGAGHEVHVACDPSYVLADRAEEGP